jgi:hypothetical protein
MFVGAESHFEFHQLLPPYWVINHELRTLRRAANYGIRGSGELEAIIITQAFNIYKEPEARCFTIAR